MQSSPWGLAKARLANKSSKQTPHSRCHSLPLGRTRSELAPGGRVGGTGRSGGACTSFSLIHSLHPAPLAVFDFRVEKKFFLKKKPFWRNERNFRLSRLLPRNPVHFGRVIMIIINKKLMLMSQEGSVSLARLGASTWIPHRQPCSVPKRIPGIEGAQKKTGMMLGCHSTGTGRAGTSGRTLWDHLSVGHLIKGISFNPFLSSKANPTALSTFPEKSGPNQQYFHGI